MENLAWLPDAVVEGLTRLAVTDRLKVLEQSSAFLRQRDSQGALAISNLRSFDRNNYPLMWLIMPGRELLLRLIYSQGRFDSSFVATALEQFETVLSLMLENSDLTLDEFSTLVNDTFRQHEVTRERMIADAGIAKLRNITRRTVAEVHVS